MTQRVQLPVRFDFTREQDMHLLSESLFAMNRGIETNLEQIEDIQANEGRGVRPAPVLAFPMPSGAVTLPVFQPPAPAAEFVVDQYSGIGFGPLQAFVTVDKDAGQCDGITTGFAAPPTTAAGSTGDPVAEIALPAQAQLTPPVTLPTGIFPVLLEFVAAIPPGWGAFSTEALRIFYALEFPDYGPALTASTLTVSLIARNPINGSVLATKAVVHESGGVGPSRNILVPYRPISLTAVEIAASWRAGVPFRFELRFDVDAEHSLSLGRIDVGRLEINWL